MRRKIIGIALVSLIALTACGKTTENETITIEQKTTVAQTTTQETSVAEMTTSKKNDEETKKKNRKVSLGEEETLVGQGGTILTVRKAKDQKGNDIYVEEITGEKGKVSYKQVQQDKDGKTTFVDVEPNDDGKFVPKGSGQSEENGKKDDLEDMSAVGNDDSNWSELY